MLHHGQTIHVALYNFNEYGVISKEWVYMYHIQISCEMNFTILSNTFSTDNFTLNLQLLYTCCYTPNWQDLLSLNQAKILNDYTSFDKFWNYHWQSIDQLV